MLHILGSRPTAIGIMAFIYYWLVVYHTSIQISNCHLISIDTSSLYFIKIKKKISPLLIQPTHCMHIKTRTVVINVWPCFKLSLKTVIFPHNHGCNIQELVTTTHKFLMSRPHGTFRVYQYRQVIYM